MRSKPPLHLQRAWLVYRCTKTWLQCLWDTYQDEFLTHYSHEIAGYPPEPDDFEDIADGDDIPF